MRILVTGATGGLGRNALRYLCNKGIDVRATGRNEAVGQVLKSQGIVFVACDLATASKQALEKLLQDIDIIWHCAAKSADWGKYQDFLECNVTATENLAQMAANMGVQCFVHISTPAVYFDYQTHDDVTEIYRATKFVNHYAATKWLAEVAIQKISTTSPNMRTVIIRPRAIFGEYDQVLIPQLLKMLKANNGKLILPRGGETVLDLTYAGNVAHAMWLATQAKHINSGEVFNITNDAPVQIKTVLQQLFVQALQQDMHITYMPYLLARWLAKGAELMASITHTTPQLTQYSAGVLAYDMTLNISKAKKLLGYQPFFTMDESIQKTADWLIADEPI